METEKLITRTEYGFVQLESLPDNGYMPRFRHEGCHGEADITVIEFSFKGQPTTYRITCPECGRGDLVVGGNPAKPCVIWKSWNGNGWDLTAKAGKKGTGKVLGGTSYWDNDKAEYEAWRSMLKRLEKIGYIANDR